jgi:protease I
MSLKGKKVAVLAEEMYQEMELWVPYYRLKEEGAEVKVVGPEKKTYKSKLGYPVNADVAASEVSARDFDGVVIPGGYAPDLLRRHQAVLDLVKGCFQQGKPVAAICHAGWVPISAGILKGKTATCFFAIKDDMINAGARYVDQEVVVDGNLITSRKPDDLPAFCRELVKALEK